MRKAKRKNLVDRALDVMGTALFGERPLDLTWAQAEGWFIHRFKLRGKDRADFLKRSRRWARKPLN